MREKRERRWNESKVVRERVGGMESAVLKSFLENGNTLARVSGF